jgi:hypothetical protein
VRHCRSTKGKKWDDSVLEIIRRVLFSYLNIVSRSKSCRKKAEWLEQ